MPKYNYDLEVGAIYFFLIPVGTWLKSDRDCFKLYKGHEIHTRLSGLLALNASPVYRTKHNLHLLCCTKNCYFSQVDSQVFAGTSGSGV